MMEGKALAQIGAIVFVAIAITATVLEMTRKDEPPATLPVVRHVRADRDPLRAGQLRCQRLGEKAAGDADCLRIWAETRDRFLSQAPGSSSSSEGR